MILLRLRIILALVARTAKQLRRTLLCSIDRLSRDARAERLIGSAKLLRFNLKDKMLHILRSSLLRDLSIEILDETRANTGI